MALFVQLKGRVMGPLDEARIRKMLEIGQIGADAQVSADRAAWQSILSHEAFRGAPMPSTGASTQVSRPPPPERSAAPADTGGVADAPGSSPTDRKMLIYTLAGAIGGVAGSLASEVVLVGDRDSGMLGALLLATGLWGVCWGVGITSALLAAGERYAGRPVLSPWLISNGLWKGAACGFLSGFIAQAVYTLPVPSEALREFLFKPFCWGIGGMILGFLLSFSIPNLGRAKGAAAGLMGGLLGGAAFVSLNIAFIALSVTHPLAEIFCRVVGLAMIGAAVGLAVTAAEAVFRTAYADILWGPRERTTVTLGPEPIWFGGGRSEVFVKGLDYHAACLVMQSGRILFKGPDGKERAVVDGETLTIGPLRVVVRART